MPLIELCQVYLDTVSLALMEGNFALYSAAFLLPFRIERAGQEQLVTTRDDLRAGFESYRAALHSEGVTDLVRQVQIAEHTYGDAIACIYQTHLLHHGHRVADPYGSEMLLQRDGTEWKTVRLSNSLYTTRLVSPPSRSAWGAIAMATPFPLEDPT